MKIAELRAAHPRRDLLHRVIDHWACYPAWVFLHTSLSVAHITLLWIAMQIGAAFMVAAGNDLLMVFGVILFQAAFIIDCADSIVGHYRKQLTMKDVYLDYVGHYIANPLFLLCYGIGVSTLLGDLRFVVVGGVAALAFLLNKALTLNPCWFAEDKQGFVVKAAKNSSLQQQDKLHPLFAWFRIEYLFNVLFWGTFLGYAHATIIIYAVVYCCEAVRKIVMQFMQVKHF